MHGYSLKGKLSGCIVHSVDMSEIAGRIAVLVEGVNEGTADEIQPYGREVKEDRHGRFDPILLLVFLAEFLGAVQR